MSLVRPESGRPFIVGAVSAFRHLLLCPLFAQASLQTDAEREGLRRVESALVLPRTRGNVRV